jgi:hypothetical protein
VCYHSKKCTNLITNNNTVYDYNYAFYLTGCHETFDAYLSGLSISAPSSSSTILRDDIPIWALIEERLISKSLSDFLRGVGSFDRNVVPSPNPAGPAYGYLSVLCIGSVDLR